MNLFFDLDGTLIDSGMRLFRLFQELIPQSCFTFEEYWQLKREQIGHEEILKRYFNFHDDEIKSFQNDWMKQIEDEKWLKLDTPYSGVHSYLTSLKSKGYVLFLITARQSKRKVLQQISEFGWVDIFKEILVTEQKYDKAEMIKPYLQLDGINWIVGDTDYDIQVGKELNINTAAVLTGFSSRNQLRKSVPDKIVNSVVDFVP